MMILQKHFKKKLKKIAGLNLLDALRTQKTVHKLNTAKVLKPTHVFLKFGKRLKPKQAIELIIQQTT